VNPTQGKKRDSETLPLQKPQKANYLTEIIAGLCFFLIVAKLGNPIVLATFIEPPAGPAEVAVESWPVAWGYPLVLALVVGCLPAFRMQTQFPWRWVGLPAAWLAWQLVAASQSIDSRLTMLTVRHFTGCVVCFYLGLLALGGNRRLSHFHTGLMLGLVMALVMGFAQHFGGLEETRRYFYQQPDWQKFPAEYLKRIASNRIFGTFVYPNAFAGGILLLLPLSLVRLWEVTNWLTQVTRTVLVGLLAFGGLAGLYWSGSKAGWLIAVVMGLTFLPRLNLSRAVRLAVAMVVVVAALTGFFVRFQTYFERGATSVGARFDYWRVAAQMAARHPVFGTGPGTFSIPYRQNKPKDAEMAQLAHNDYLEQASDSGVLGAATYGLAVLGSVFILYRKSSHNTAHFATWIGLFAWSLQGFVEFSLYTPALAWAFFALLGWLWAVTSAPEKLAVAPR